MSLKPHAPGGLIGRAAERAELAALLDTCRLITLVGPGGVGKTRLALDVARGAQIGALFVPLDGAEDAPQAVAAVAEALEVQGIPGEPCEARSDRVAWALSGRGALLLVLDNVEQVLDAAPWFTGWLAAAPELTILITSRAPLAVAGERIYELGPMSVEDARRLFDARAAAAGLREAPAPEAVDALLARLDRVPLAVELAAARARVLSPAALLDSLDRGQPGLGRGAWRDRPARQIDLAASFEWSWRLLTPAQRDDLTRCAIFRGAFDVDAAVSVLAERGLDGLADLIEHSLIQRIGPDQFANFTIVRDFVSRQGAPAVAQVAAARHRGWYIPEADRRAAEAHGPQATEACRWLVAQQGNVVAAIGSALEAGEAAEAVRGLRALRPLVYTGAISPAYGALLKQAARDPVSAGWARCLYGELLRLQGRLTEARGELVTAAAVTGDARLHAEARAELGIVAHELGDLARAAADHEAALAGFEAVGDRRGVARALGSVAVTRHARGQTQDARECYEQALDLLDAVGDRRSWAIFTSNLGDLHLESGRLGEARACYEDARAALLSLGDRRVAAAVTGNLGGVLLAEDEVGLAIAHREEAVSALEAVGDHRMAAIFRGYLGLAHHAAGALEIACQAYTSAEQVLLARGDRRHGGIFSAFRAAALAALGDVKGAERALEASTSALSVLDEPGARAVPAVARGHLHLAKGDRAAAEACLAVGEDQGEDLIMAHRLLRRALGTGEAEARQRRLVVARDGAAFQAPGGPPVDLGKRYILHRILLALLEIRQRSPSAGLEMDALMEAGWPGEFMSQASGANRVYVAIATLRREGLEDVLIKRPAGYMLDPSVPVVVGDPLVGEGTPT